MTEIQIPDTTTDYLYLNWTENETTQSSFVETFMTTENTPVIYCGDGWANFWRFLAPINMPSRGIIAIVGIFTNILNILVFTRKPMRNATNTLLTALCVSDLLCLLRVSEEQVAHWIFGNRGWNYSYAMALHNFANEILVNLFHSWSVYLTLAISFWRLIGVAFPLKSLHFCTPKKAHLAAFFSVLFGVILMIPMYCYAYIHEKTVNEQGEHLQYPEYYWTLSQNWAWHLYLWTYILFIKVVPCSVMTVVTTLLVGSLLKAKARRSVMTQSKAHNVTNAPSQGQQSQNAEYDKTTRMLIIILVIFIVTEFPFAIINLLNSFLGHEFLLQCKNPALAFLNLGEYLSCATSFFVYFALSKNFRHHFNQLFPCCGKRSISKKSTDESKTSNSRYYSTQSVSSSVHTVGSTV